MLTAWNEFGNKMNIGQSISGSPYISPGTNVKSNFMPQIDLSTSPGQVYTISSPATGQDLPIELRGLKKRWAKGMIDMTNKLYWTLGAFQREARGLDRSYLLIPERPDPTPYYLGHMAYLENCRHKDPRFCEELFTEFFPAATNANGKAQVEIHNPTDTLVRANLVVPIASHVSGAWKSQITVLPRSTVRCEEGQKMCE
jgi:hypothetical protein